MGFYNCYQSLNSKERYLLEEYEYYSWYDTWYENDDDFFMTYYMQKEENDNINYDRLPNGLVDWSNELSQSTKRNNKISEILDLNSDNRNSLEKYWPNRQL